MNESQKNLGYELSDAKARPLLIFGVCLAVLSAVSIGVTVMMEGAFKSGAEAQSEAHPLRDLRDGPPGPLLQATTSDDLESHRLWESHVLSTHDWVERDAGIVRVPVDEAMRLYLADQAGGSK